MAPDVNALGRSVVVGPGEAQPPQWRDSARIAVGRVDADIAGELHRAWLERRSLVIELRPGLGLDDPSVPPPETVVGLQPWEWDVGMDLPADRLHHSVWANSVDARGGGAARWRWSAAAEALGARSGGGGDVVLPDGTEAVCDGGPLDAGLGARVGLAVLHRFGIEHRSLEPLLPGSPDGVALAGDQLAAVGEPRAGARVIAPAGSGKTRVLTERARLVTARWKLPPAATALVAYNRRAAEEMRSRLSDLPELRIRTLNALGLRLCGRPTTIEETGVRRILADLVALPRRAETDPAAPWIEALSRVRLGMADPDVVEAEMQDVSGVGETARRYRAALAERDAVDFDEQIVVSIERLLADPAFRERSRRFARILLVDEFQDLTPAHLLLLRLLSGPAGAVFGVGDDDQTIYGYAGATPRWLVDFERWFPGSADYPLEVNYRCRPAIVNAASNLLTRNGLRVPKVIRASRNGEGGLEVVYGAVAPAAATVERVAALLEGGAEPTDVAVLSRVNSALVPVQVLLSHRGIPVDGLGDGRFLTRSGVRAAVAWLTLATSPGPALPSGALREAARRPKRGLSNSLLDLLARPRKGGLEGLAIWLERRGSLREAEKVEELSLDVALVRRLAAGRGTTADILAAIRSDIASGGLDASARALDQWGHGSIAAHLDDLDALAELAVIQPDPSLFGSWLADRLAEPATAGVTVASIHAVKGREWRHIVVHHATDGLLPHRLSEDEEEERRILHVGITRAVETCTIVTGASPSPFLAELDAPGSPPERRRPAARVTAAAGPPPASGRAEERLRAWRDTVARSTGKPHFTVFSDRTLRELAARMPISEAGLLAVPGIGQAKLDAYGADLIALFEEISGAGHDPTSQILSS